jgi:hypothetical protein
MVQAEPFVVYSPDSPASLALKEAWIEFSSFLDF